MAVAQLTHKLGLISSATPNAGTLVLSDVARLLLGFMPSASKTVSKIRVYTSAVAGTIGASDLHCDLYSAPAGISAVADPATGTLIRAVTTVTTTPTGASWIEFTGFSDALTIGTQYFITVYNTNASAATTNRPTLRWSTSLPDSTMGSSTSVSGWFKRASGDSGSTWGTNVASVAGLVIEYNDGTIDGTPFQQGLAQAAGVGVYSTRESGALFTTPADVKLKVAGIGAWIFSNGSPTGSVRFRLYEGTSLVATTASSNRIHTANVMFLPFSSSQVLSASTTYRIVLGETTQSDTSGNRFNLYEYVVDNTALAKAALPFGSWVGTYYDGSSWSNTDTSAPVIWMLLDADDPFDATSSGGGAYSYPFGG